MSIPGQLDAEHIFRSRLNPDLPRVRLSFSETGLSYKELYPKGAFSKLYKPEIPADRFLINRDDSGVFGEVHLMHSELIDGSPISYIGNVWRIDCSLGPERRNKGAVLASYVALAAYSEQLGEKMQSGVSLTMYSVRLWKILVGAGIAELEVPFRKEIHDGKEFYLGCASMRDSTDIARLS